jgi:hypothetical protein
MTDLGEKACDLLDEWALQCTARQVPITELFAAALTCAVYMGALCINRETFLLACAKAWDEAESIEDLAESVLGGKASWQPN